MLLPTEASKQTLQTGPCVTGEGHRVLENILVLKEGCGSNENQYLVLDMLGMLSWVAVWHGMDAV